MDLRLPETKELVLFILRWIHVGSAVVWLGLLYFFNFVNVPFGRGLDDETKKKVVPQLMPRALFWFRWAAMVAWLSGLLYLGHDYFHARQSASGRPAGFFGIDAKGEGVGLLNTDRGRWIAFGAGLATIMWCSVWMVIGPRQRRIVRWVRDGQTPPEMDATVATVARVSRLNTYVSVPMLFGMLAGGGHYAAPFHWAVAVGVFAISFVVISTLYRISGIVGAPPPP